MDVCHWSVWDAGHTCVAVYVMMCWMSRHVKQGRTCSISATMPAAMGAAADVPVCPSVQPVPCWRDQSDVTCTQTHIYNNTHMHEHFYWKMQLNSLTNPHSVIGQRIHFPWILLLALALVHSAFLSFIPSHLWMESPQALIHSCLLLKLKAGINTALGTGLNLRHKE